MQRLLVRRPAQWSRHLLARSTLRSADASLHATRCQRGDHPSGAATGFSRSPRPPCRSSRFGADGSAGICQSAMPPSLPLCSERRSVGSGQPRTPAWGDRVRGRNAVGSTAGRAKGATTPVAVARSARFWSALEGPPLMLAAPRPAGRDPGPAPPMLHKYVWLRQPPGRGWGARRRNHRKRTAEGRRHWESAIIASGDGAFRHRTPRLLPPRR